MRSRHTAPWHVFTEGVQRFIELITQVLPNRSKARRERAIVTAATLVGALLLARAVDDKKLSDEILR